MPNTNELVKPITDLNSKEIRAYLDSNEININTNNPNGATLFHCAAKLGDIELLKYLKAKGADHQAIDCKEKNALYYALNSSKTSLSEDELINLLEYLVGLGVNIKAKSRHGETLIHSAVYKWPKYVKLLNYLIDKVIEINEGFTSFDDNTALHMCTDSTKLELLKFLVQRGADVNVVNDAGETPIFRAVRNGNVVLVDFLIKSGAKVNMPNNHGAKVLQVVEAHLHSTPTILAMLNQASLSENAAAGNIGKSRLPERIHYNEFADHAAALVEDKNYAEIAGLLKSFLGYSIDL